VLAACRPCFALHAELDSICVLDDLITDCSCCGSDLQDAVSPAARCHTVHAYTRASSTQCTGQWMRVVSERQFTCALGWPGPDLTASAVARTHGSTLCTPTNTPRAASLVHSPCNMSWCGVNLHHHTLWCVQPGSSLVPPCSSCVPRAVCHPTPSSCPLPLPPAPLLLPGPHHVGPAHPSA
jgi:hypothetical protein